MTYGEREREKERVKCRVKEVRGRNCRRQRLKLRREEG